MVHEILDFLKALTDPERLIQLLSTILTGWLGYLLLFGIVFAETGLLFGFFLPGDSLLFTVGVTLATSAINVFYRDVNPVVQIGLQLWLYLTPVAYPLSAVPDRYRLFFLLNPLTGVVEGLRAVLVFGREPEWGVVAISAGLIVTIFVGALILFKSTDKYFADVI